MGCQHCRYGLIKFSNPADENILISSSLYQCLQNEFYSTCWHDFLWIFCFIFLFYNQHGPEMPTLLAFHKFDVKFRN